MNSQTLRQVFLGFVLTMSCVSDGFIFGQLSGMIDALKKKESAISLTDEDISWIASAINISCIFGFAFMVTITDIFGRRRAITIVNLPVIASWILLYFAKDKTILIVSRLILGACYGGVIMLVFICIAEYHPPNVRPLCLNLITSVGSLIGNTLGHVLGIILHWRYMALIGVVPSILAAVLPFFLFESPAWLASKGKFDECEKAFRALHSSNEKSDNELILLLAYEKKKLNELPEKTSRIMTWKTLKSTLSKNYLWKISLLGTILCIYRISSGKIFFTTLAITMLQDITCSSDILLYTIVVDGFSIIGAILSCVILTKFKIRNILFTSGLIANICLIIFSLSLFLYPGNNSYYSWLKIFLLTLYFVIISAGPCPVLDVLLSEIFPIEIKSLLVYIIGSISSILQFISIKFANDMITQMGYHGVFFLNAVIIFLCLLYLWFYMPETKDRSLHEIEYFLKNGTFDYKKEMFNIDQTSDLLSNCKS